MVLPKMIDDICALNAISREAIVCKFELTELFGQETLLKTILNNLLRNAFQYGRLAHKNVPMIHWLAVERSMSNALKFP